MPRRRDAQCWVCLREFDRERTSQIELSIKTLLETEASHRGPLLVSSLTSIAVSSTGTSVTSPSIRAAYLLRGNGSPACVSPSKSAYVGSDPGCAGQDAPSRPRHYADRQRILCKIVLVSRGEASKQSRLPRPARSAKWRAFLSAPWAGTAHPGGGPSFPKVCP